ncbi:MAG TPA: TAXI family TRAP transporter solute-binding subunit, partial [Burkholderiales bacterium]|nr:TAXI family TRAP transporter solute-binding subunit [Burkholderiales bacterium]
TKLMAYDYVLTVGAHVKDDVVYNIAKAVYSGKPKLVESLGAFRGFDPDNMGKKMPAPFHPGAMKFYQEKGIAK